MAPDGSVWTWNSSRYLAAPAIASAGSYTLAVPLPSSSVATPVTTWLAGWMAVPPHTSPAAPPMPICIGPAAPNALAPLCTPGKVVGPLALSTVPMPARIVHGTPYCWPTFLYQNRKSDGIDLAFAPAGGCPAVPVCWPEQPALAAKKELAPIIRGIASMPRPTRANSPMMPSTRSRGARCSRGLPGGVGSVRVRSRFAMTAPRSELARGGPLAVVHLPAGAGPGDRDGVLRAAVAAALGGGQVLGRGGDEGQAGGPEGAQRVDHRRRGGHLLLVVPDLGHAGRGVQALQGGGQLPGDQAAHLADVGFGAFGVGVGVVIGEELLRHRGGGGQSFGGERQPRVDVHAAGRGRRRRDRA